MRCDLRLARDEFLPKVIDPNPKDIDIWRERNWTARRAGWAAMHAARPEARGFKFSVHVAALERELEPRSASRYHIAIALPSENSLTTQGEHRGK